MNNAFNKLHLSLFLLLVAVLVLFTGGRIASSDETAFFLETQSLVEQGTLAVPSGIVNNVQEGIDGKFYVGGGIGYTLISVPFYVLGKIVIGIFPIPEQFQVFILKGAFSLTNVFVCASLGILFFAFCNHLRINSRISLFLTLALIFSTNLFVYAKSSMREPMLTLCLLGAIYALTRFRDQHDKGRLHVAGICLAMLLMTKISFVIILPIFGIYFILIFCQWPIGSSTSIIKFFHLNLFWRSSAILIGWIVFGLTVVFLCNYLSFGNILSTGYARMDNPFSNSIWVGIYGLLSSSGKSIFIYAPITLLVFWGFSKFYDSHPLEAWFFISLVVLFIVFHAKFIAWAGDGSWGPRYLIPILPLCIIMSAGWVQHVWDHHLKRIAIITLVLLGTMVQFGGNSVFYGSYLRHIKEFPYTKAFNDPEFLYRSHFVPNYSPAIGHWELFFLSLEKHANGEIGILKIGNSENRIPLADSEHDKLIYLIDYWFMYLHYAGVNLIWILIALALNIGLLLFFGWRLKRELLTLEAAR